MKKIYSKYLLEVKVDGGDYLIFQDKNTKEILETIHFANANTIDFYLENEFLNDFIFATRDFYFLDELIWEIRYVLRHGREQIFKKAKQLNFILTMVDFDFGEDKKEVVVFYVKEGKRMVHKEIVNKFSFDLEDFIIKFVENELVGEQRC